MGRLKVVISQSLIVNSKIYIEDCPCKNSTLTIIPYEIRFGDKSKDHMIANSYYRYFVHNENMPKSAYITLIEVLGFVPVWYVDVNGIQRCDREASFKSIEELKSRFKKPKVVNFLGVDIEKAFINAMPTVRDIWDTNMVDPDGNIVMKTPETKKYCKRREFTKKDFPKELRKYVTETIQQLASRSEIGSMYHIRVLDFLGLIQDKYIGKCIIHGSKLLPGNNRNLALSDQLFTNPESVLAIYPGRLYMLRDDECSMITDNMITVLKMYTMLQAPRGIELNNFQKRLVKFYAVRYSLFINSE